jgi:hypothetical protein
MPQVSVNLLKNMRFEEDITALSRVGNVREDRRCLQKLYEAYESLLPYEKR